MVIAMPVNGAAAGVGDNQAVMSLGTLYKGIIGNPDRWVGLQKAILLCARDVASGMAYLHSKGAVHADLKPANVLLKSAHASVDDPRSFTCKARSLPVFHRTLLRQGVFCAAP